MKFQPSTEEQIEANSNWDKGVYPFTILDAEEKKSRKGNPMIELKIEITRRDGAKRIVRDYLLAQRPAKLLHAATVCDLWEKYRAGVLGGDDFVGKTGKLKLGIQRETGEWPRRNVVVDYV
jgi:hypothetical protein